MQPLLVNDETQEYRGAGEQGQHQEEQDRYIFHIEPHTGGNCPNAESHHPLPESKATSTMRWTTMAKCCQEGDAVFGRVHGGQRWTVLLTKESVQEHFYPVGGGPLLGRSPSPGLLQSASLPGRLLPSRHYPWWVHSPSERLPAPLSQPMIFGVSQKNVKNNSDQIAVALLNKNNLLHNFHILFKSLLKWSL